MKLYAILEDVDLGYHCIGIFSDPQTAEGHMKRLCDERIQVRLGRNNMYIAEFLLDDFSQIEEEISWRQNLANRSRKE